MRRSLIALGMLLASASSSYAQLSLNFDVPGARIGINVPVYPSLQPIPGYPVYYAPGLDTNYFFYDGLYWVFDGVNWYASSWYNGPWSLVDPLDVPLFVLRVPVRYYRAPPAYFHGWGVSDAPRWGDHWGQSWSQHRTGWDQWKRGSAPAAAPLPTYQRQYSGSRYPQAQQQQASLEASNYRYQPKDPVAQTHFQQARTQQAQQQAPAAQPQRPQQQAARQQQQPARAAAPAPQVHEQQASRQQQQQPARAAAPAPQVHEQQAARQQQQPARPAAPPPREQQAARPQPQHTVQAQPQPHVERPQQQAPAREQQAAKPQAQGNERGNEKGKEEGHENK